MKDMMDKLEFIKIKNFRSVKDSECQENEKTGHKLGENICKRYI